MKYRIEVVRKRMDVGSFVDRFAFHVFVIFDKQEGYYPEDTRLAGFTNQKDAKDWIEWKSGHKYGNCCT